MERHHQRFRSHNWRKLYQSKCSAGELADW
jgi:hypothetical protein